MLFDSDGHQKLNFDTSIHRDRRWKRDFGGQPVWPCLTSPLVTASLVCFHRVDSLGVMTRLTLSPPIVLVKRSARQFSSLSLFPALTVSPSLTLTLCLCLCLSHSLVCTVSFWIKVPPNSPGQYFTFSDQSHWMHLLHFAGETLAYSWSNLIIQRPDNCKSHWKHKCTRLNFNSSKKMRNT